MIKLLDSFQAGDAFVCTIFADTKAEVPETALGIEELVGDVCAPIAAGTLIITSAFETAFVRSDGLIQWKGDPAPTPPPGETVTLTTEDYPMYGGDTYLVEYKDANNEDQTASFDEETIGSMNLSVLKDSVLTLTTAAKDFITILPSETSYTLEGNVFTITMSTNVVLHFSA